MASPVETMLKLLEQRSGPFIVAICLVLVAVFGFGQYVVRHLDPDLTTSIFYVIPIAIATWFIGRTSGFVVALISAGTRLGVDYFSGVLTLYIHQSVAFWNALVQLLFFVIIVYLLSGFRRQHLEARQAAETDPLTGALNRRAFARHAEEEIERSRRFQHPFTLAFLDLDNFKAINDQRGHIAGDDLLRQVVRSIRQNTRKTDLLARVGGDEFAILFAETGYEAATQAIKDLRQDFVEFMQRCGWPVTFSAGLITYEAPPAGTRDMVQKADELMYEVKRRGKDQVLHRVWTG